jgi:hypothetical protein
LHNWIAAQQDDITISRNDEVFVPGLLFDLVIEYQVGIAHLVSARINGPAFALVRASFEALVRGCWLQLCAAPEQIKKFTEREELPLNFGGLIEAVEQCEGFGGKVLSTLKTNSWTAMNSYTHGGMLQVSRRWKGGTIEPNYSPEEIIEVLKASGTFALMALRQIAVLGKKNELLDEVNRRLSEGGEGPSG